MEPLKPWSVPDGGYGAIVADPPWLFKDNGSRATADYDKMTVEEICALPVLHAASAQSHLYLWCPSALLRTHPWDVFDAWGFEYKTAVVWRKLTARNRKVGFGNGHYFRAAHEVCLFGTRGQCPAKVRNMRSLFDGVMRKAPNGKSHSRKPDEFPPIVEQVSRGPYLELFARESRPGWVVWGDEAPQDP